MIKLSGSIKAELIPGTPENLDKKGFTWELVTYNNEKIELKFTFEHPKFISASGEPDTMKISFNHTSAWMNPANDVDI